MRTTAIGSAVASPTARLAQGLPATRRLLEDAARRQVDAIVVWKLDRAFRSVAHMATTTEQLRRWGVRLRSYSEP